MTVLQLLAQAENPITSISRRLQESEGVTSSDFLIFAAIGAAIAILALVLTFAGRAFGWWSRETSASLFRELCNAHELNSSSRSLLWKLARGHQLKDPSLIFLSAEKFEDDALPDHLRYRSEEIGKLQVKLFGMA